MDSLSSGKFWFIFFVLVLLMFFWFISRWCIVWWWVLCVIFVICLVNRFGGVSVWLVLIILIWCGFSGFFWKWLYSCFIFKKIGIVRLNWFSWMLFFREIMSWWYWNCLLCRLGMKAWKWSWSLLVLMLKMWRKWRRFSL